MCSLHQWTHDNSLIRNDDTSTMFLIKPCFIIPNIRCRYNKSTNRFLIRNENAPQHTDIVWKGLLLQTRTWKWTAVIIFAISCISNSSNSNNSSNNVTIAINNSSGINNSESQRKEQTFVKVMRWSWTDFSNADRPLDEKIQAPTPRQTSAAASGKKEAQIVTSLCNSYLILNK